MGWKRCIWWVSINRYVCEKQPLTINYWPIQENTSYMFETKVGRHSCEKELSGVGDYGVVCNGHTDACYNITRCNHAGVLCFVLWFDGCSCVFVALATIFWTDISVTKYGPLACHWQQNCTCTVTISISDFKIWWWRKQSLTNSTTKRFLLKIRDHSICGCYLCDASDFQICCIENYNGHTTVTLCQEPDKQIR